MRGLMGGVLLVAIGLTAGGCNDNATPTEPAPPTATVTENFTGTLAQNGGVTYNFSAAASGAVTATLTDLQPDDTLVIGFALGTSNGTTCTLIVTNDKATKSSLVSATATGAVSLCLRVYDIGNVVKPVTYAVELVHP